MIRLKINDYIADILSAIHGEQITIVCDDRISPDNRVRAVLDLEKLKVRTTKFAGSMLDDLYTIRDRSR